MKATIWIVIIIIIAIILWMWLKPDATDVPADVTPTEEVAGDSTGGEPAMVVGTEAVSATADATVQ